MSLATIALISFIVSVVVHALKGALDALTGKFAGLKKIDDIAATVEAVDDKVDSFIQDAAKPKA